MSKEHKREPIKHTCHDIDKYIKWIKIIIAKHRNGALEDIMVNFDGKCTNFYTIN